MSYNSESSVQLEPVVPGQEIGAIIPTPRGRKIAYSIYAGLSLVIGNTVVAYAAIEVAQPVWLVVASAVVANLAAPFSALAIANAKS